MIVECINGHKVHPATLDLTNHCDKCRAQAKRKYSMPPEYGWPEIRAQRDDLLLRSDWVDVAISVGRIDGVEAKAWLDYREFLRDVTEIFLSPHHVEFPNME